MSKKIILYHGSKVEHNSFDIKYIGSNANTGGAGPGFYFTPDIEEAALYGNVIYRCELKLNKQLNNHKLVTFKNIRNVKLFIKLMYKYYGENYYENYGWETFEGTPEYEKDIICYNIIDSLDSDTEFISDIMNSGSLSVSNIFQILDKFFGGINYTIDKESNKSHSHYIMYNPKDIKILDKTKY